MSSKKKIVIAVVITAVASSLLTLAAGFAFDVLSLLNSGDFSDKVSLIEEILDRRYLYDYDKDAARETALSAYVEALDEPYTEYYSPEEYASYVDFLQDGYVGIGVMVTVDENDRILVIASFEDSPAFEAGIEPGDILKAVNGTEYSGTQLTEAINVIRGGPAGTTVDLTLLRGDEEINLTVERGDISNDSVKSEMLDDGIGYMRITQFNMQSETGKYSTSSEFKNKLADLTEQGMTKLIIDLRDNPGGILPEVCDVADELLDEGLITYMEDKNGNRREFKSDKDCIDIPIVVLINGNSASASEVLTGALKDRGRATVVGEKSFGKGIVQDVFTLPDGSGISLTSARYFTPNGVCIHEVGIEPDVEVHMPDEYKDFYASMVERDKDTQLQKAIEIIKEK